MPLRRTHALILSRPVVLGGFAIALLLVCANGWLTALSTRDIAAAERSAAQTQAIVAASNQLLATVAHAEAAARSSTATRDGKYAADIALAHERSSREVTALETDIGPSPGSRLLFARLRQQTAAYFTSLAQVTSAAGRIGRNAPAISDAATTAQSAEEIRRLVEALQRSAFTALAEQAATTASRAQVIKGFNATLVAAAVFLAVIAGGWLIRRIRDLDTVVTVCAWTRRVRWEGRWVSFEEYLQKRFDLRFTHGICEEAAEKMHREAERAPAPAELRRPRIFPKVHAK